MYALDTNTLIYFFKGMGDVASHLLIAATAIAHKATLVTHNTQEFRRVRGLSCADWY